MTTIYVKPDCPYCEAALRELESRGEPYTVVDILADPGRPRRPSRSSRTAPSSCRSS